MAPLTQYAALFFLVFLVAFPAPTVDAKCSSDSCRPVDRSSYNVHIVAHSHMDLGWLKTVEQYFFGTNAQITSVGVQYIYDSVLTELLTDSSKRFMFVETGFFELWWNHRTNETKEAFRRLVMNGQIEFVSGGYVMNDEADVYYMNTIDQMTYGLGILKELFGDCGVSRIGWQIDPFGHSREFASLLSQMGFKGLYFGRIDYQDKDNRELTKTMEFKWQASQSLAQAQITGVVLANGYSPPPGFCFDEFCDDEVIVEDEDAEEYNADKRVTDFLKYVKQKAAFYSTSNLLLTMGNDFNYQNAHKWMKNLDKLIRLINDKGYTVNGLPVKIFYSTPSCYLKSIQDQKMSVKTDDFFPYSSDPHAFWTGYFTSRPAFKYLDRFSNNVFQAAKQLASLADLGADHLEKLKRGLAIAQHHDAITGTAKQHVNNDYTRIMSRGLTEAEDVMSKALKKIANNDQTVTFCRGLNISECDQIDGYVKAGGVSVAAYNPLSAKVRSFIRVPVSTTNLDVLDANGAPLVHDIIEISEGVKRLAERKGKATHEVVVPLEINPLDFTRITITPSKTSSSNVPRVVDVTAVTKVKMGKTVVTLDPKRGMVSLHQNGVEANVSQKFYYYESAKGNNTEFQFRASGAYIFRPHQEPIEIPLTSQKVILGKNIIEVQQKYSEWLYQTIRITGEVYSGVELDWVVGPIPFKDGIGKEIITRFESDLTSGNEFYTDSNGREMLKRIVGYRPTWNAVLAENVSGNYYPVNTRIMIRDSSRQLTLFNDRSEGGSSLASGQMELMIHRRCLYDDAFGVGEPLNETGYDGKGLQVRGTHRLELTPLDSTSHRTQALEMALKPVLAFTPKPLSLNQTMINTSVLGENLQLLSFEQTAAKEYLIRLENFYEKSENPKVAVIDLQQLLRKPIAAVRETLLAANIDKPSRGPLAGSTKVQVYPMQIRTFFVTTS